MTVRSERRAHILERSLELFALKGFHVTSISEIASHSGIGKSTVYEYFQSKDELCAEAVDYLLLRYRTGLEKALRGAESTDSVLGEFVRYHRLALAENAVLIHNLSSVAPNLGQQLHAIWRRHYDSILGLLQEFVPGLAATVVYGAVNQYCLEMLGADEIINREVDSSLVEILLKGCRTVR